MADNGIVHFRKGDRVTFHATVDRDHLPEHGDVVTAEIKGLPGMVYGLPIQAVATHEAYTVRVGDTVRDKDCKNTGKLLLVDGDEAVVKEDQRGLVIHDLADLRRV